MITKSVVGSTIIPVCLAKPYVRSFCTRMCEICMFFGCVTDDELSELGDYQRFDPVFDKLGGNHEK